MRDNSDSWNKVLFPERYQQSDNYRGNYFARKLNDIQTNLIARKFKDIKTSDELKSISEVLFSEAVGNKVEITIDDKLMPLPVAKAHLTELLSIVREYEIKQGKLTDIVLGYKPEDELEYGVTITNPQTLNKTIKLTNLIPIRSNSDAIDNSRCDKKRLQFSLATHECGHLLFNCNFVKNTEMFLAHEFKSIYSNYINEITQLANNTNINELSNLLIGYRGSYTTINEFIAECFQEYRNSSNPSKYSIIIGNLIDSYFKKK